MISLWTICMREEHTRTRRHSSSIIFDCLIALVLVRFDVTNCEWIQWHRQNDRHFSIDDKFRYRFPEWSNIDTNYWHKLFAQIKLFDWMIRNWQTVMPIQIISQLKCVTYAVLFFSAVYTRAHTYLRGHCAGLHSNHFTCQQIEWKTVANLNQINFSGSCSVTVLCTCY